VEGWLGLEEAAAVLQFVKDKIDSNLAQFFFSLLEHFISVDEKTTFC
jgi:hypothetical protein